MGETLKDAKQRIIAATPEKEVIVQAGAGSGKTTALQSRFMNILEQQREDVDRVVAITFTEAAASEILKKIVENGIRKVLDELGAKKQLTAAEKKKIVDYRKYYESLKKARISTIHAFCNTILKEYAADFGYDVNLIVLEEETEKIILDDAVSQFIARYIEEFGDTDADFQNMLLFAETEKELRKIIKALLSKRYRFFKWLNFYEQNQVEDLYNGLRRMVGLPKLRSAEELNKMSLNELKEYKEALTGTGSNTKDEQKLRQQILDLPVYLEKELFEKIYPSFTRFMRKIIEYFEEWKAEYNFIDFLDMELRVVESLSLPENRHILKKIRSEINYLMVDEFQDTSDLQWRLISLLIKEDEELGPRPNLFVVGDEKQSIYYFREADVSIFKRTIKEFEQRPEIEVVQFSTNFRSGERIIDFVNRLFKRVFDKKAETSIITSDTDFQAEHQTLYANEALKDGEKGLPPEVEIIELDPLGNEEFRGKLRINNRNELSVDARDEYEAEIIARRIVRLIKEEGVKPGDIALLFRRRTKLKTYLDRLAAYGIKAITFDSGYFYENDLIKIFFNILSFLNNYTDDVSLVGTLRSFLFGVSDDDIATISFEEGNYFWEKFERFVAKTGKYSAEYSRLKDWLGYAKKSSIYSLVKKIYNDTNIFIIIQRFIDPQQEEANLNKFLQDIAKFEGVGYQSLESFVRHFKEKMETGVGEEALVKSKSADEYIKIMTIHAAKGLEFKVVVVPEMSAMTSKRGDSFVFLEAPALLREATEDAIQLLGLKLPSFYAASRDKKTYYERVRQIKKIRERYEAKRLFYVALTRAEEKLILPILKFEYLQEKYEQLIEKEEKLKYKGPEYASARASSSKRIRDAGKVQFKSFDESSFSYFLLRAIKSDEDLINYLTQMGYIIDDKCFKQKPDRVDEGVSLSKKINTRYMAPIPVNISRREINVTDLVEIKECENLFLFKIMHGLSKGSLFQEVSAEKKSLIGIVVHKVMEIIDTLDELENDTREKLIERAEQILGTKLTEEERITVSHNLKAIYVNEQFRKSFQAYDRRFKEFTISFSIDDYIISGIVDLVLFKKDSAVIWDYKTGKEREDYAWQLKLYAYGLWKKYNLKKIDAYLLYTAGPKTVDKVDIGSFETLQKNIDSLTEDLRKAEELIKKGEILPLFNPKLKKCQACGLKGICSNFVNEDESF